MKPTNIFYAGALVYLFHKWADYNHFTRGGKILHAFTPVLFTFLSPLLVVWYFVDVVANILDLVSFFCLVEWPVWSLGILEELEKKRGKK